VLLTELFPYILYEKCIYILVLEMASSGNQHCVNYIGTLSFPMACQFIKKGKGSPYSIEECRVPELIPVLGSQPAGDMSHKPGGRLPLLSARPAVTVTTLKRTAANLAAW